MQKNTFFSVFLFLAAFTVFSSNALIVVDQSGRPIEARDYVHLQVGNYVTWSKLRPNSRSNILHNSETQMNNKCYYNGVAPKPCADEQIIKAIKNEFLTTCQSFCIEKAFSSHDTNTIINIIAGEIDNKIYWTYGINKLPKRFFDNYFKNMAYEVERAVKNLGISNPTQNHRPYESTNNQEEIKQQQAETNAFFWGAFFGGIAGLLFREKTNPATEPAHAPAPAPVTPSAPPYQAVVKRCTNCKKDVVPNRNNACSACHLPFY
jgi:hypothetical protein